MPRRRRGQQNLMQPRPPRIFGLIIVIGCGLGAAWCSGGTPVWPTPPPLVIDPTPIPDVPDVPVNQTPITPTTPTPPAGATWINVFGDTGWCGSPVMPQIAGLLNDLGGDILLAGDLAYDSG